jgi:hypothetical protein
MPVPHVQERQVPRRAFSPTGMTSLDEGERAAGKVTDVTRERSRSYGTLRIAVTKPYQSDYIDWDKGRDGYINSPTAHAPATKPATKASGKGYFLSVAAEERCGSLLAAGGTIWAAYVATVDYAGLWRMQIMPPGPVEICVLGVLTWLHAKWRRSMRVN